MFKRVLFLLLVLGLVSNASAYVWWDGSTGNAGTDWSVAANWDGDVLPAAGSNPAIGVYSFTGGLGLPPMPTVSSDMSGTVYGQISIGRTAGYAGAGAGQMRVTTNGYLKTNDQLIGHGGTGADGIFWIDGGIAESTFTRLGNANNLSGTLVQTGGLFAVSGKLGVGRSNLSGTNSPGTAYLHGGLTTMDELEMRKGDGYYDSWLVADSWIDITTGQLETFKAYEYLGSSNTKTGADAVALIQDWVDGGYITAYGANLDGTHITGGGSLAGWSVDIDWNTGSGLITLTAVPEPATMLLLGLGGLALIRRKR